MAFKKKPETSDEVYVVTLPLRHTPEQQRKLDKIFFAANQVKNALIAKKLRAMKQMERTREYRALRKKLSDIYEKLEDLEDETQIKEFQREQKALFKERNKLLAQYGLTKSSFEKDVTPIRKHFRPNVGAPVAQKIAADVWSSFQAKLYGNGKDVHFSQIGEFTTISGKSNYSGIRFLDGCLVYGKKLKVPVKFNKKDPYGYETEALKRDIHFCDITRRWYPDGWRYFIQLVLAGKPPIKVIQSTGEVKYPLGIGLVGNDIGPQTLFTAANTAVRFNMLAGKSQDIQAELRRINRAMDRSRRATNPKMFKNDGTVVPIDELPPECIRIVRGTKRRKWVESKQYKKLAGKRKYLYQAQARSRIQQHHELVNWLVTLGDTHYIEKMNWAALQKRAKKTEISEKTGKYKRKKRFGRSIANRSPATFVNIYEQKVLALGGKFYRTNPFKQKASQYDHLSMKYTKKTLGQRWQRFEDGTRVQRDAYSAFLIKHTNETLDGYNQAELDADFQNFLVLHNKEMERLMKMKNLPSSLGLRNIA